MKITKEMIKQSKVNPDWDFANGILYNLCKNYPKHTEHKYIIAKVWLIGRSYAAAIERGRRKDGPSSENFYETDVAPKIRNSKIDVWLNEISDQTLETAQFAASVKVHAELTALFETISGLKNRSLASKYLHFHKRNAFFIYDSRAEKAVSQIEFPTPKPRRKIEGDEAYCRFVLRCFALQEYIKKEFKADLTSRQIDNLLLQISAELNGKNKG